MAYGVDVRTILLIEDNDDDRARIHRMLSRQRRRYDIVDCRTGREALDILARDSARFDCVLLDWYLPDMDGDEVLYQLRGPTGRPPVAISVLAGHDDDVAATRALELGAEDYLLKDEVTPHALARSIENVADKFEIRRQLEAERAASEERKGHLEVLRAELDRAVEKLSRRTM